MISVSAMRSFWNTPEGGSQSGNIIDRVTRRQTVHAKRLRMTIRNKLIEELLTGKDPKEVFAQDGLLDELRKALA
ncbi:MAG: hypothetical protein JOZ58_19095, partial [Acetobacteraceae bacterium]|nr:hypothetical protein [Acetobacteraceae bacterium]